MSVIDASKNLSYNTSQHPRGDALHLSVAIECAAKQFVTLDMAQASSAKQLSFEVLAMLTSSISRIITNGITKR